MAGLAELSHKAQRAAASVIIDHVLSNAKKDREKAFLDIVDFAEKFWGDGMPKENYDKVREAIRHPEGNKWIRFINRVLDETDPHVAKMAALNLGFEAFFRGTKEIRKNRKKYDCNIPWLILFDPTSACNMHCTGCWSGTYGHKHNLSFEDMDKIVTQGKELGVYLYMMTGGEPLVRKKDILKLAEKHNDVEFSLYTNSTLIDEDFCKEVTSDEFLKMIADKGARFGFYFHYMPVGNNAAPELMPTMEQRKYMIERIRYVRSSKSDIEFYPMDFQNDGEFVGGCIAGGRNYFHINSAGDAEPCVFIHYSNTNIHDNSILEMLQSPLFMAYHDGQPFNHNHLRPCPMLENPELLQKMVHETGAHSTDLESPESVEHLCDKCKDYAACWAKEADEIWTHETHKKPSYQNYKPSNIIK